MTKEQVSSLIQEVGIIPAIRVSSSDAAHFAVEAVANGGIPIVEITMTVPEAVGLISHIARFHPKVVVGAGTVLKLETAQQCVDAGAGFITAPGFSSKIVEFAVKQGVAVFPGALTPTEVVEAWEAGSDFVKVFPCSQVGGETYIKALNTALPQIPLIAAGGVNQRTARDFILAGAIAVGVGNDLIPRDAIERKQSDRIRELAHRFLHSVTEARHLLVARKQNVLTHVAIEKCESEKAN